MKSQTFTDAEFGKTRWVFCSKIILFLYGHKLRRCIPTRELSAPNLWWRKQNNFNCSVSNLCHRRGKTSRWTRGAHKQIKRTPGAGQLPQWLVELLKYPCPAYFMFPINSPWIFMTMKACQANANSRAHRYTSLKAKWLLRETF